DAGRRGRGQGAPAGDVGDRAVEGSPLPTRRGELAAAHRAGLPSSGLAADLGAEVDAPGGLRHHAGAEELTGEVADGRRVAGALEVQPPVALVVPAPLHQEAPLLAAGVAGLERPPEDPGVIRLDEPPLPGATGQVVAAGARVAVGREEDEQAGQGRTLIE